MFRERICRLGHSVAKPRLMPNKIYGSSSNHEVEGWGEKLTEVKEVTAKMLQPCAAKGSTSNVHAQGKNFQTCH